MTVTELYEFAKFYGVEDFEIMLEQDDTSLLDVNESNICWNKDTAELYID